MQKVPMMSRADDDGDDDDELKARKDFSRPCRRGRLINMPLAFKEKVGGHVPAPLFVIYCWLQWYI